MVYFRINSAKIDKNQQVSIFNTAQFMKENNVPIKVIGYADKKTGTGSYNMQLSEKRARAVAKELIDKYGISSSQITIEWKGSDVQPQRNKIKGKEITKIQQKHHFSQASSNS